MIQGKLKWALLLTVACVTRIVTANAGPLPECINETFQEAGKQTRWDLCFTLEDTRPRTINHGLIIQTASFSTHQGTAIKVLKDARVSELFVAYHDASHRFFDVSVFSEKNLNLTTIDCPASVGVIVGNGKVCKEMRDRGIAWKKDEQGRRGKELVLWSVLDAFNYNYVIEWAFHDDGTIIGRAGTTGPKLGARTTPSATRTLFRGG